MNIGDRVIVKCRSSKQGQVGTVEYIDSFEYSGLGVNYRLKFEDSKLVYWFRECELTLERRTEARDGLLMQAESLARVPKAENKGVDDVV